MDGDEKEREIPEPKFCSCCGRPLGEEGHRHGARFRQGYGGQGQGRGEKWAKRLKTWGGAMSGLFSILFYIFFFSLFLGGGSLLGGGQGKSSETLYGQGEDKVAVVDISGVIMEENVGGGLGASGVTSYRDLIRTFEEVKADDKVRAVVLRVNSPGGSVTASESIYQLVKKFKRETGLPVIVSQGDTAASGGYYVSLAGDEIVSDATTLTGSIGAIIESVNFKDLADRLGVQGVIIASGKNKALLNPFEEVVPEQREMLQNIVDSARNQFVARILESRPVERAQLEPIADGRVLTGEQAKADKLVDRLGTFSDAVQVAEQKAGVSGVTVVVFGKKGLLESLLGAVGARFNLTANTPLETLSQFSGKPAYLYIR